MIKKLVIGIGILFGLFVVAAVSVPMFVDVDKYRPQIVQAANERLNGKLELGKLALSLWGQIHIQVDGLKLSDAQGHEIVAVKDAYFRLPFLSILSGSPSLILSLQQPEIHVVKNKVGKLNALSLMKQAPTGGSAAGGTSGTAGSAAGGTSGATTLPAIATRARIGVEIKSAALSYKDEMTGMSSDAKDLNLVIHDISLSHKMTLDLTAGLDSEMQASGQGSSKTGGMQVKGPARVHATADPKVSGGKFESVDIVAQVNLDDLEIGMSGLFHKAKGVDAHADLQLTASQDSASFQKLSVRFFNAELDGKGGVTHMQETPVADFSIKSNPIELRPWVELVPMLKQYELGGSAEFSADAKGPSTQLQYKALLEIKGLTAKAPNLKAQPKIDALVSVVTDQVDRLSLTMKAPGNDLSVTGKVIGFNAPHVALEVASNGMDLDQLIDFPPKAGSAGGNTSAGGAASNASGGAAAPATDLDTALNPIRENKALQSLVANIGVNIRSIQMRGMKITDIQSKISMHDLIASIDSLGLKIFSGTVKASASTNLRPKAPTYRFGTSISNLDLREAVASQFQAFKNTVLGKASFDMNGEGASLNTPAAISNLKAKGKMRVTDATLTTVDAGTMASEGLGGSLSKISDKIPGLKGKLTSGGNASKYDVISSDFNISDARFNAPNFVAKAAPNAGIDLKGDVQVGLKDQSLKANFQVIDTYNMTHARDISVSPGGFEVDHVLADGNQPVQFPISVGCTLGAPCYGYGQVADYLLKIAMRNAAGSAKKSLLQGLLKQAPTPGASGSNGSPGVQNALQNLGSKLFGH